MEKKDYMKIGRYQTWIEDGVLKMYSHEVGTSTSVICSFNANEALGLLELLSEHRDDINHALYINEQKQAYQGQNAAHYTH